MVSVTDGHMRLMWRVQTPARSELYDLAADPGEHENLWEAGSSRAEPLEAAAREYYENAASPWGTDAVEVELDELRLNQLRALGYMIR
jgi:hypothetical protein